MRLLISGSHGFVGRSLASSLAAQGHSVVPLARSPGPGLLWDPAGGRLNPAELEGFDGVVHLAGESIAAGRWTEKKKRRIRDSRVRGTRLLAESLAGLQNPPRVFVGASAMGYYGDRGEEVLREESAPGTLFLSAVCREWESAAQPLSARGVRVVHARFGLVLGSSGGALAKMLPPFRLGLGGVLGRGDQYMSWISLDDAVGALLHALSTESLSGPVNAASPAPVTNREFTKTLGRVLGRPTIFPLPAWAARLIFGQMAEELLLASARLEPAKLLKTGFTFRHPDLETALRHVLK